MQNRQRWCDRRVPRPSLNSRRRESRCPSPSSGCAGAVSVERGRWAYDTCSACPSGVLRHPITANTLWTHEYENRLATCMDRYTLDTGTHCSTVCFTPAVWAAVQQVRLFGSCLLVQLRQQHVAAFFVWGTAVWGATNEI